MKRIAKYCVLLILCLTSFGDAEVQAQDNTQREEVQRYFGYEILPYRYLSLPFDVSVNSNERGSFVDISCLYFMFLPLFLIAYLLRWKLLSFLAIFVNLFIWVVGSSNSYIWEQTHRKAIVNEGNNIIDFLLGSADFTAEKTTYITAYLYYVSSFIYKPFFAMVQPISGDSDAVTYPFLILMFLLGTFILNKLIKAKELTTKAPVIVYWVFLFFWFKFSAGIPWYGFFIFFMSMMMIMMLMKRGVDEFKYFNAFLKYSFYTIATVYLFSGMVFRISNVDSASSKKTMGTDMMSPYFFNYQIGRQTEEQTFNTFFPQFNRALNKINGDPSSYILRIGTSFSYFIENNSARVKMDNQLGFFDQLNRRYNQDKNVITDALLTSNVKYIIIDLNTPYIDKTPEQSLKKKYDQLMNYVKNNPRLNLLCTNRVFTEKNPKTGKWIRVPRMFKDPNKESKIFWGGQYGVYEIVY